MTISTPPQEPGEPVAFSGEPFSRKHRATPEEEKIEQHIERIFSHCGAPPEPPPHETRQTVVSHSQIPPVHDLELPSPQELRKWTQHMESPTLKKNPRKMPRPKKRVPHFGESELQPNRQPLRPESLTQKESYESAESLTLGMKHPTVHIESSQPSSRALLPQEEGGRALLIQSVPYQPPSSLLTAEPSQEQIVQQIREFIYSNTSKEVTSLSSFQALLHHAQQSTDLNQIKIDTYSLVEQAILGNKPELISVLRRAGMRLDMPGFEGRTPATFAILMGQEDMLLPLKKEGVNFDVPDGAGQTPAELALLWGETGVLRHLEQVGADLYKPNKEGQRPKALLGMLDRPEYLEAHLAATLERVKEDEMQRLLTTPPAQVTPEAVLVKSIYAHDFVGFRESLDALQRTYSNLDMLKIHSFSLVERVVLFGSPDMLAVLQKMKVNLNMPGLFQYTPTTLAVKMNKSDMVRALSTWTDINEPDAADRTPVMMALLTSNFRMLSTLQKSGADFNATNRRGWSPAAWAIILNRPSWRFELERYGASWDRAEQTLFARHLQTVWGIESDFVAAGEGIFSPAGHEFTYQVLHMKRKLEKFLNETALHTLTKTEIDDIQESLIELVPSKIIEKLREGKVLFLPHDFTKPPHAVCFVLHHNTFMICNRGAVSEVLSSTGVNFFSFDPLRLDFKSLTSLLGMEDLYDLQQFLTSIGCDVGHPSRAPIAQKPQKVRNCTWTSLESGFLAVLYSVLEKRIPDPKNREKQAKEIYKSFTTFARQDSLQEYLAFSGELNIHLLFAIQEKIFQRSLHLLENQKRALAQLIDERIQTPLPIPPSPPRQETPSLSSSISLPPTLPPTALPQQNEIRSKPEGARVHDPKIEAIDQRIERMLQGEKRLQHSKTRVHDLLRVSSESEMKYVMREIQGLHSYLAFPIGGPAVVEEFLVKQIQIVQQKIHSLRQEKANLEAPHISLREGKEPEKHVSSSEIEIDVKRRKPEEPQKEGARKGGLGRLFSGL